MSKGSDYRDRMTANGLCPDCGKPNTYKYFCKFCAVIRAKKQAIRRDRLKDERQNSKARS